MVGLLTSILNFFRVLLELIDGFYCWFDAVLANPGGFLNSAINVFVDAVVGFLPSTPDNLKLSFIVGEMLKEVPFLGFFIVQVVNGVIFPILALYLGWVLYKALPFT